MSKDYTLQIKIKNGPMLRAMRAAGIETAMDLSRLSLVSPTRIGDYLNLKLAPLSEEGEWRADIKRISVSLKTLPEDLFPQQHLRIGLKKNVAEIDMSPQDIAAVVDWGSADTPEESLIDDEKQAALKSALLTLPPREQRVLSLRFGLDENGEHTLDDTAELFGLSRERIRQIERRAIRKLSRPQTARHLSDAGWAN